MNYVKPTVTIALLLALAACNGMQQQATRQAPSGIQTTGSAGTAGGAAAAPAGAGNVSVTRP